MKKLLMLTLVVIMAASAAQPALAADDDGSSAILSQIESFKAKNQEKIVGIAEEETAPEHEPQHEESSDPESVKPAQQRSAQLNPASVEIDRIVREAMAQASQEISSFSNNSGVVEQHTLAHEPAEESAPESAPTLVEDQAVQETSVRVRSVQIPTTAFQPASQPMDAVAEVPAGRPLNPTPMQPGAPETEEGLLVTVDWLKDNLKNVVLIDARPESLYLGGHIPGAVNAPWTYFANMDAKQGTDQWGVIWSENTMAKRLGVLGVDGKKMVVAYCDVGGWGQSGWTLWILRQAGVANAKLLQGGIAAWRAAGGAVATDNVRARTVFFSIKNYAPNYTATTQWINDNLGKPGLFIIDVRTLPEYNGRIRPFKEKRAGHLPGALHIPREEFVTNKGYFKSAEEIESMLARYGITPDSEIVVYDTAGVRSAFVTMVLRYAGFLKSQSYDAGFQAWAGNPDLPIVTQ